MKIYNNFNNFLESIDKDNILVDSLFLMSNLYSYILNNEDIFLEIIDIYKDTDKCRNLDEIIDFENYRLIYNNELPFIIIERCDDNYDYYFLEEVVIKFIVSTLFKNDIIFRHDFIMITDIDNDKKYMIQNEMF